MRYGEARGLESRDVQTGDGASGTYTVGWILGNVVYDLVLEYAPCCHTSSQRAPRQHARVGGATMASNAEANIAKALELKAQGNEAFKAADYKQAMVHYHQVRPARAGAHHTPNATLVPMRPWPRQHPRRPATRAACRTVQHARHGLFRRLEPAPDCLAATRGCAHTRLRVCAARCRSTCTCTASPRGAARAARSRCPARPPSR